MVSIRQLTRVNQLEGRLFRLDTGLACDPVVVSNPASSEQQLDSQRDNLLRAGRRTAKVFLKRFKPIGGFTGWEMGLLG